MVIADAQRVSISLDSTSGRSQLRLGTVMYSDAGNYSCRAFSQSGFTDTSDTAVITVQGSKSM